MFEQGPHVEVTTSGNHLLLHACTAVENLPPNSKASELTVVNLKKMGGSSSEELESFFQCARVSAALLYCSVTLRTAAAGQVVSHIVFVLKPELWERVLSRFS